MVSMSVELNLARGQCSSLKKEIEDFHALNEGLVTTNEALEEEVGAFI